MTTKQTVFIVTCGEYSDYRIVCVFSTAEKAEDYVNIMKAHDQNRWGDEYYIEPYDLDDIIEVPKGMKAYHCFITKDNGIEVTLTNPTNIKTNLSPAYKGMIINVWAENSEHAIKIASEQRAMAIANNQWRTL